MNLSGFGIVSTKLRPYSRGRLADFSARGRVEHRATLPTGVTRRPAGRLVSLPQMSRSATVVAVIAAVALAACGGSSKSSTTTTSQSSTTKTGAGGQKAATAPLQQVVAHVKGAVPGNSATVNPGTPVVIVVKVPSTYASKQLTIGVTRTGPTTFTATSSVVGAPLHQSSLIHVGAPNAQITSLRWKCTFPKEGYCPVRVVSSSATQVNLSLAKHPTAVKLTMLLDLPGSVKAPSLIPLGLPAAGTAVQATVKVTAVAPKSSGKSQKPPAPSTSVTAVPGSVIEALVQVPPGTPAQENLRIAIPQTSGHSITIQAGGTAASPASTATVLSSSGNIHVSTVTWACQLPPATFCPLKSIGATTTGLQMTLPTPRIPVSLALLTEKG